MQTVNGLREKLGNRTQPSDDADRQRSAEKLGNRTEPSPLRRGMKSSSNNTHTGRMGSITSSGLSRRIPTPSRLRSRRRTELRFTVHGPARAKVSPCCHRPSGGDFARDVHISIALPRIAGDALENRLALTIFRRDMLAVGATLRHVRCWNEFDPAQGRVPMPHIS
jgi:hypothetical protein